MRKDADEDDGMEFTIAAMTANITAWMKWRVNLMVARRRITSWMANAARKKTQSDTKQQRWTLRRAWITGKVSTQNTTTEMAKILICINNVFGKRVLRCRLPCLEYCTLTQPIVHFSQLQRMCNCFIRSSRLCCPLILLPTKIILAEIVGHHWATTLSFIQRKMQKFPLTSTPVDLLIIFIGVHRLFAFIKESFKFKFHSEINRVAHPEPETSQSSSSFSALFCFERTTMVNATWMTVWEKVSLLINQWHFAKHQNGCDRVKYTSINQHIFTQQWPYSKWEIHPLGLIVPSPTFPSVDHPR